jgi:uncharacterized protein
MKTLKKAMVMLAITLFALTAVCSTSYAGKAKLFLTMGTGGIAGTYYPFGGIITSVITQELKDSELGVSAAAQSTGGSVDNINLMKRGQTELALSQNDIAYMAYHGVIHKAFEGKPWNKIRAIGNTYPEVVHIVALEKSGINSIYDLKGKRVSVGDLGSGGEVTASDLVAAAGMSYKDFSKTEHLSVADSVSHIKDGQLDAMFFTSRIPVPGVQDLASIKKIKLVTIDDKIVAKMQKGKPWFAEVTIPKGSYKGIDNDVQAIAVLAMLCTTSDLSEELVYQITKSIYDNTDTIASAHAAGKAVTAENAIKGMTIPLHDGAARYFKEKGLKLPIVK